MLELIKQCKIFLYDFFLSALGTELQPGKVAFYYIARFFSIGDATFGHVPIDGAQRHLRGGGVLFYPAVKFSNSFSEQ